MTWFKRRKRYDPTESASMPQRCHVCGARMGTTQIAAAADPKPNEPSSSSGRWLCAKCLEDFRRSASEN
jgi:hypothetical protein